jgi:hypothetical protein
MACGTLAAGGLTPPRLGIAPSRCQDREHGTADKERWYCFDDTSVEPWDPASLDKDCFGGRFVPEGLTQVPLAGGGGGDGTGAGVCKCSPQWSLAIQR